MTINRITDGDVGRLYQTNDGQILRVLRVYGPLIYGQMESGKVYYPIHDIQKRLTEVEPKVPRRKKYKEEGAEPNEKKPRGNKNMAKPVTGIAPDGTEHRFPSLTDASNAIGISAACISAACRGLRNTAAGYIWKYDNQP